MTCTCTGTTWQTGPSGVTAPAPFATCTAPPAEFVGLTVVQSGTFITAPNSAAVPYGGGTVQFVNGNLVYSNVSNGSHQLTITVRDADGINTVCQVTQEVGGGVGQCLNATIPVALNGSVTVLPSDIHSTLTSFGPGNFVVSENQPADFATITGQTQQALTIVGTAVGTETFVVEMSDGSQCSFNIQVTGVTNGCPDCSQLTATGLPATLVVGQSYSVSVTGPGAANYAIAIVDNTGTQILSATNTTMNFQATQSICDQLANGGQLQVRHATDGSCTPCNLQAVSCGSGGGCLNQTFQVAQGSTVNITPGQVFGGNIPFAAPGSIVISENVPADFASVVGETSQQLTIQGNTVGTETFTVAMSDGTQCSFQVQVTGTTPGCPDCSQLTASGLPATLVVGQNYSVSVTGPGTADYAIAIVDNNGTQILSATNTTMNFQATQNICDELAGGGQLQVRHATDTSCTPCNLQAVSCGVNPGDCIPNAGTTCAVGETITILPSAVHGSLQFAANPVVGENDPDNATVVTAVAPNLTVRCDAVGVTVFTLEMSNGQTCNYTVTVTDGGDGCPDCSQLSVTGLPANLTVGQSYSVTLTGPGATDYAISVVDNTGATILSAINNTMNFQATQNICDQLANGGHLSVRHATDTSCTPCLLQAVTCGDDPPPADGCALSSGSFQATATNPKVIIPNGAGTHVFTNTGSETGTLVQVSGNTALLPAAGVVLAPNGSETVVVPGDGEYRFVLRCGDC